MFGFNKTEIKLFKNLSGPRKIQDFLNKIPINFERGGETCYSPRLVLRKRRAHCLEGALLAAAALRFHGFPPLVMDLKAADHDFDHVVAVFRLDNRWGAISKTNHAVLRYREPVYKSIRELVMSFFHEYFTDNGRKTLRSWSLPVNLSRFDKKGWQTAKEHLWYINDYIDSVRHKPILNKKQLHSLRKADFIERQAGKLVQWKR